LYFATDIDVDIVALLRIPGGIDRLYRYRLPPLKETVSISLVYTDMCAEGYSLLSWNA
jgi:hypothetical protein